MKSTLTLFIVFFNTLIALAQNDPVISGDIMLCPESNGNASITNDETYDSYQWYFKYWLDQTGGDPIQAYMHYNGGPGGPLKPLSRANAELYAKNLDYFQESKFIKKSAILEGMSKVNI